MRASGNAEGHCIGIATDCGGSAEPLKPGSRRGGES